MSERTYPLPRPESGNDPRFTFGLTYEVGKVLESHGFPSVRNGSDHTDLMMALFRFIYGSEAFPEPRAVTSSDDVATAEEERSAGPAGTASPLVDGDSAGERETVPTTPYWAVIYTNDQYPGEKFISPTILAKTAELASERWVGSPWGDPPTYRGRRAALNVVGPFDDPGQAESYRESWSQAEDFAACDATAAEDDATATTRSLGDPGGPYWLVISIRSEDKGPRPEISFAVAAANAPAAKQLWEITAGDRQATTIKGPYQTREAAYVFRSAWLKAEGSR